MGIAVVGAPSAHAVQDPAEAAHRELLQQEAILSGGNPATQPAEAMRLRDQAAQRLVSRGTAETNDILHRVLTTPGLVPVFQDPATCAVVLVTLLSLLFFLWTLMRVGRARGTFGVAVQRPRKDQQRTAEQARVGHQRWQRHHAIVRGNRHHLGAGCHRNHARLQLQQCSVGWPTGTQNLCLVEQGAGNDQVERRHAGVKFDQIGCYRGRDRLRVRAISRAARRRAGFAAFDSEQTEHAAWGRFAG